MVRWKKLRGRGSNKDMEVWEVPKVMDGREEQLVWFYGEASEVKKYVEDYNLEAKKLGGFRMFALNRIKRVC